MNLILKREVFTTESTIGTLLIDGQPECFTLEDRVRTGPKVPGVTAIPRGRYEVVITWSDRFQCLLPLLVGVVGFQGIRIHAGNRATDTEGCILLGQTKSDNFIGKSRAAVAAFLPKLTAALQTGKVFIVVTGEPEVLDDAA